MYHRHTWNRRRSEGGRRKACSDCWFLPWLCFFHAHEPDSTQPYPAPDFSTCVQLQPEYNGALVCHMMLPITIVLGTAHMIASQMKDHKWHDMSCHVISCHSPLSFMILLSQAVLLSSIPFLHHLPWRVILSSSDRRRRTELFFFCFFCDF